jgi:hypothetical protein
LSSYLPSSGLVQDYWSISVVTEIPPFPDKIHPQKLLLPFGVGVLCVAVWLGVGVIAGVGVSVTCRNALPKMM